MTLNEQYIEDRNITNVADALNELPIYNGSVTPAGAQGTFGQGVNFLNTFGLGSNRNLTLINGRRFVNSNPPTVFNNAGAGTQVDLNVVPTILVDRIETVAIGGAPIYGSDAIASTTNVILRTDFEGLTFTALTGISEEGDNFRYQVSGVGGINLLDDRLNITVAGSHDVEDGLLLNERDFFRANFGTLRNIPSDGARAFRVNPNLGDDNGLGTDDADGNPPFALFRERRIPTLSRSGRIQHSIPKRSRSISRTSAWARSISVPPDRSFPSTKGSVSSIPTVRRRVTASAATASPSTISARSRPTSNGPAPMPS